MMNRYLGTFASHPPSNASKKVENLGHTCANENTYSCANNDLNFGFDIQGSFGLFGPKNAILLAKLLIGQFGKIFNWSSEANAERLGLVVPVRSASGGVLAGLKTQSHLAPALMRVPQAASANLYLLTEKL